MKQTHRISWIVAACLAMPLAALAHTAHSGHDAAHPKSAPAKEQKPWGIAGDAKDVRRTIQVAMTDNMRFTPGRIEVRQGETVRLVVKNAGKVLHELVIGTRQELDQHAAMMQKFPNMEHDEPYMAHVAAGKTGQLVWNFNRAGDFEFACLVPGHYQAGMIGKIRVLPAAAK
ncbi:MAG: hypothetical protein RIS88_2524 [Pseudomonadota bacterium]|jgi:uncharacterized cupredoxin-like copper-binding protein